MRLILVRHAQTTNNSSRKLNEGHTSLSREGFEQSKKVARRLRDEKIDVIYTSPMLRTRQTADYVKVFHPEAELRISPLIREKDHGIFIGKPIDELIAWTRSVPESQRLNIPIPGGESVLSVRKRIQQFLRMVKKENKQTVLVITHNICLRCFHSVLIDSFDDKTLMRNKNTGVTIVELSSEPAFETIACAKHLE